MALNIKKIEGPLPAFEVEDTSQANAIVSEPKATQGADLNLKEEEHQGAERRRHQQKEIKQRCLWYKKLWVLSRP